MKFTYRNNTYVIDRYWQVLGTPEHSIPNERIAEWGRYVFHFSRDKEEVCDWSDKHLAELVSQIESNNDKGEFWRNIPLVREFIHELKDVAPFRSDAINPAYKAHYIQRLLSSASVVRTETPRLYHSLSELYRLYIDYKVLADYDEFLNKNFDEYFFRDVDIWIYNFSWIVNYPSSDTGKECWNILCAGCLRPILSRCPLSGRRLYTMSRGRSMKRLRMRLGEWGSVLDIRVRRGRLSRSGGSNGGILLQ